MKKFARKGFTLVEMLVYMAVSAMVSASLISLAFTLADAQAKIRQDTLDEETGIFVLRVAENALRNHAEINLAEIAPDAPILNISKSSENGISSASFTINDKSFSISVYEK